ncbi:MAG: helix-turn-helix domain-containing protein [Bacteroidales bacterium]|jgi:transcriptional regulator with XRE-family HTH domain|nr:helix-turn-helix domain-containing protein [Bacteroidales bacterium]
MVKRIIKIMEDKNLSSAHFADAIGVQRSTLSHILSERNKPSLDIIIKILNTYPEINADWLIKGSGKQYSNGENHVISNIDLPKDDTSEDYNLFTIKNNMEKGNIEEKVAPENKKTSIKKEISRIIILFSDGTYDTFVK